MRILIACDKYKGSLTATEVSEAIGCGIRSEMNGAVIVSKPIADGGEGFVNSISQSIPHEVFQVEVLNAVGKSQQAEWVLADLGDRKVALIEMSAANGLAQIPEHERDVFESTTYGTGQLIRAAAQHPEVDEIMLGLGGSATNDAGLGMILALGARFETASGMPFIGQPSGVADLRKIHLETLCSLPPITAACDVDNPLLGSNGASAIYGPQKGATPEQVIELDESLQSIVDVSGGEDFALSPGAGAAGGLGFGLIRFLGAKLVSGFDLVSEMTGLVDEIKKADIVITGEGRLDSQSLFGKGPVGVAKLAKQYGKKTVAIAGALESGVDWTPYFDVTVAVSDRDVPLEEVIRNARFYTEESTLAIVPELKTLI